MPLTEDERLDTIDTVREIIDVLENEAICALRYGAPSIAFGKVKGARDALSKILVQFQVDLVD